MIHYESSQGIQQVPLDFQKYQNEKPTDYDLERVKGLSRIWGGIIYPDAQNYPFVDDDELREALFDFAVNNNLTGVLSPCHNQDVMPDGSLEKPHFHVYFKSSNPRYSQAVASLTYAINGGITPTQKIDNEIGYWRYMIHTDDVSKAQYQLDDVTVINGYKPPASGDKVNGTYTEQLLEMVKDFGSVRELTAYVIDRRPDLFNTLIRSRCLIATYYGEYERRSIT